MNRSSSFIVIAGFFAQLTCATTLSAQSVPNHQWSHGTTLGISAGGGNAPDIDARGALGAAVGWEINRWIGIEGAGTWLVARRGNEAFAADLTALVNLTRPQTAVPFVAAGVGLMRASFDSSAALPDFYRRPAESGTSLVHPIFTDPTLTVGAGVNIAAGGHLSVRPDIGLRLVMRGSDTYPVTVAAVHVIYHFEVHDVGR